MVGQKNWQAPSSGPPRCVSPVASARRCPMRCGTAADPPQFQAPQPRIRRSRGAALLPALPRGWAPPEPRAGSEPQRRMRVNPRAGASGSLTLTRCWCSLRVSFIRIRKELGLSPSKRFSPGSFSGSQAWRVSSCIFRAPQGLLSLPTLTRFLTQRQQGTVLLSAAAAPRVLLPVRGSRGPHGA